MRLEINDANRFWRSAGDRQVLIPVAADSLHMARKIAWGPSKVKHGCATILPTPVCGQRARSAPLSPPPRRRRAAPSLLGRRRPTPNATPPPPHATASGANGAELNLCRNRTTGPGTLSLAMASQSTPPIGAPPAGAAAPPAPDGAVEDELATVQWRNESVALN